MELTFADRRERE